MFVHTEGYVAFFTPPIHNFRLYLEENSRLKKIVARQALDIDALRVDLELGRAG